MKKFRRLTLYSLWALGLIFVLFPVVVSFGLPDEVRITRTEFEQSRPIDIAYIRTLTQSPNAVSTVGEEDQNFVDLKLFGVIPVRRIKVDFFPYEKVLTGGVPVGFTVETKGLIVTKDNETLGLKRGDIITNTNCPEKLKSLKELNIDRNGKEFKKQITQNGDLGLWVKSETSGVGMLTYVNPENNNFASLGHRISDFETGASVDVTSGNIYLTEVHGIEKSHGRKVGHFKNSLVKDKHGSIHSSNPAGVFGCLNANSSITNKGELVPIMSRYNVKPGKAILRTSIDGIATEDYEIEIIKNRFQKTPSIKSMIIKITDKRLLDACGGIVHGMSGSPILQDGKMIGALTHVMISDVTKGYGIYIDFVLPD